MDEAKSFFKKLFTQCGEDPERQGLIKTPERVVHSFLELTQGYHQTPEEICQNALFDCPNEAPVRLENIPFYALCEHHLLPFFGHCTVTYLPHKHVLGLSKIYRVIELFSKRLQLQERLTLQIAESLYRITGARGLRVDMQAEHLCVAMRGIEKIHSKTLTSSAFGEPCPVPENGSKSLAETASLSFKTKEFPVSLGVLPEEKARPTPVSLQVSLDFPTLPKACQSDQLADTVCYDQLSQQLYSVCTTKHFNLIEHCGYEAYHALKHYLQTQNLAANLSLTLTKKLTHAFLQESCFHVGDHSL